MINDVLDYSQILADKFVLDIKGKYLLKSLEKLRYLTEFQAKKKGISFHISISQKLNYKIWTDHSQSLRRSMACCRQKAASNSAGVA